MLYVHPKDRCSAMISCISVFRFRSLLVIIIDLSSLSFRRNLSGLLVYYTTSLSRTFRSWTLIISSRLVASAEGFL
jgi:hypothetical protein